MMIKTILQWLFVYLPVRFTIPFMGLLAWFLFYLWPWLLDDVVFPSEMSNDVRDRVRSAIEQWLIPGWIEALNLTSAAKAAAILGLLAAGVLLMYNLAALCYQLIRRWRRERLLIGTILLNLFIYSYPWIFAPKDWSQEDFSLAPFYLRTSWVDGFAEYGVLWLMPAAVILSTLAFELIVRRKGANDALPPGSRATDLPPIENRSFDQLKKSFENKGQELRIGLILSGGGAKGVYQAGAMKAIHEFLEQQGSLGNVKMIAGTSIGSWNTMFWLADYVKADPGKTSAHEEWWRTTNVERIVEFDKYIPFLSNSALRPVPWRENFDRLFDDSPVSSLLRNPSPIHFYLTRSNVAQGRLEFGTNWGPEERTRALRSPDIQVDSFTETRRIDEVKDAVFASMDLPPLFPYQQIGYEYFEDGGVIDNLPVRFGTFVEECDLLFILALNSSFEAKPEQHSMFKRLMRVMDVRQGVLERNSMRMAYLYNSLNALKGREETAAVKSGKVVRIFAICPEQPLDVDTSEFWKTDVFPSAFHTMYNATRVELSQFDFAVEPHAKTEDRRNWLRMALVSPAGEITYNYRF